MLHKLENDCLFENIDVINIELTNKCNLTCKMCYRNDMNYPLGIMDVNLFDEIIKKINLEKINLERVYLHWRGEPTLVDYLPYAIKQFKTKTTANVILFTNGILLQEALLKKIITSGLDILGISLDTSSSNLYTNIRGNNVVDIVKKSIDNAVRIKSELSSNIKIVINTVLLKENFFEIEKIIAEWENKVDNINVKENAAPNNKEFRLKIQKNCRGPFHHIFIAWDGFCFPCCIDVQGTINLGNINDNTFYSMWKQQSIFELRKALVSEKVAPLCKGCPRLLINTIKGNNNDI